MRLYQNRQNLLMKFLIKSILTIKFKSIRSINLNKCLGYNFSRLEIRGFIKNAVILGNNLSIALLTRNNLPKYYTVSLHMVYVAKEFLPGANFYKF